MLHSPIVILIMAADLGMAAFENIASKLSHISNVLGTQGVSIHVKVFDGENSKDFGPWVKGLEKYTLLAGLGHERILQYAYQASTGCVSNFIHRFLTDRPNENWTTLKTELTARFGDVADSQYAFSLLRNVRQKPDENVQIFAERLLSLAEQAFPQGGLGPVEMQIVGFFIDGLTQDFLRLRLMRENPNTLQAAVRIATTEQNLRKRFNLRTGRRTDMDSRRVEPMEIDHIRPDRHGHVGQRVAERSRPQRHCLKCNKIGHDASYCRSARSINAISHAQTDRPQSYTQTDRPHSYECWYCGKPGHIRRNCRQLLRQGERYNTRSGIPFRNNNVSGN